MDQQYEKEISKIEDLKDSLFIQYNPLSVIKDDVFNSTNLEGNLLSKREVTYYLENDVTIRGKSFRDFAQIHNYRNVLLIIEDLLKNKNLVLSEDLILQIHKMVTENELPYEESVVYRSDTVHIRYTDYIPPLETEVPELMTELVRKYNDPLRPGETQFERICEFKRNFERIHPFFDGNGRTGRVLMNLLFLQNGYGYVSIRPEERDLYFQSLDNNTFHLFLAPKMLDSLTAIQKKHLVQEDGFDDFEK